MFERAKSDIWIKTNSVWSANLTTKAYHKLLQSTWPSLSWHVGNTSRAFVFAVGTRKFGMSSRAWIRFQLNVKMLIFYLNGIFTRVGLLQMYVAKDIQSLCRHLRKTQDVFKERKVLVEKGKVAPHKLTNMSWKRFLTIFTSTSKF